jgi:hypothetical protein
VEFLLILIEAYTVIMAIDDGSGLFLSFVSCDFSCWKIINFKIKTNLRNHPNSNPAA